ncbi:hypothetical protein PLESTB_000023400 [Pleodorina starrii]|uniref:Uncharacterized protein n=1 Tax=Pleodorina starrii TaxID=330485 RepID=A0A9W6BA63_9CHLO|nr:hypothetical protein PLESTM_001111400 [Pleodorina starrii]GLC47766.1 hypothetical protein PLESTB_000023400 [Pleodorina starrii]
MSSAHPDRFKLATGATTIVRAPIARGKSGSGAAPFWGSLSELNSVRDQLDRNSNGKAQLDHPQQQQQQEQERPSPSGMPPIPGAGPVPWRDAVTASSLCTSSSKALLLLQHPRPGGGGGSRRSLLLGGGQPSSRALLTGAGAAGGGAGPGAVSFRRNGVASAPVVGAAAAAAAAAGGSDTAADADRRRLPAINSMSRPAVAAAATPCTAPPPPPATGIAALPSAIRGAIRRNIVSLPSIHVTDEGDGGPAGAGAGAGAVELSSNEEQPILVSFAPSRPPSGSKADRAMRRGLSRRPTVRVVVDGDVAAAAAGGGNGGTGEGGGETSSPGGGGLLRGIRRLFGKESALDAAAASRAAAGDGSGPTDDTVRQDDTASSLHAQRSSTSVAYLAYEHVREQERVNRVRSSLLGAELQLREGVRQSGGGAAAAAADAGAGGGGFGAGRTLSPRASQRSRKWSEQQQQLQGGLSSSRVLRSGKSFTQRALEDPQNPAFKTAKQLAALQEKLSYMEDLDWREKAAAMVTMERPTPIADGWKL